MSGVPVTRDLLSASMTAHLAEPLLCGDRRGGLESYTVRHSLPGWGQNAAAEALALRLRLRSSSNIGVVCWLAPHQEDAEPKFTESESVPGVC